MDEPDNPEAGRISRFGNDGLTWTSGTAGRRTVSRGAAARLPAGRVRVGRGRAGAAGRRAPYARARPARLLPWRPADRPRRLLDDRGGRWTPSRCWTRRASAAHVVGHDWGGAAAWVARGPARGPAALGAPFSVHTARGALAWRSARQPGPAELVHGLLPAAVLPERVVGRRLARSLTNSGLPARSAAHYLTGCASRARCPARSAGTGSCRPRAGGRRPGRRPGDVRLGARGLRARPGGRRGGRPARRRAVPVRRGRRGPLAAGDPAHEVSTVDPRPGHRHRVRSGGAD